MLCLGETTFFSGNLDEAERLLLEAERILVDTETAAGQAMVLERLAELALARGQKWRAGRLVQRGLTVAETSWFSPHLVIRLKGLAVKTASTPEQAAEVILEGDRALALPNTCQPCSMGFRAAAAVALAEAGELEEVGRRLDAAERLAGMWNGGPWVATLWEARGVQRRAQGSDDRALAAFSEAAGRFADLGRPLDEARCQASKAAASPVAPAEPH
jgi:ATP/maltotriose-dependent transcriptional regulator MalT